ncbi:MAG TPA: PQQ-binding-like beta-propeller repeat protein [Bryobacteraceae bacterium]
MRKASAFALFLFLTAIVAAQDGSAIYRDRCASCHEGGVARAPQTAALKQMSPANVQFALKSGVMQQQGSALTEAQIRAVSEFVTGKSISKDEFAKQAYCTDAPAALDQALSRPHWNGWGVDASNQRFQPAAMAQLASADVPRLKLKWAFGFPGDARAFAQPAVVGGRVFVGSQGRRIYSLNASTGCIYWAADADFPVRSAVAIGQQSGRWMAYFGDQHANAYALDAMTGALVWKTRVNDHPVAMTTGAPTLFENRLYVPASSGEEVTGAAPNYPCCRFRGSVTALDAATGKMIWHTYTIPDEPKPTRKNQKGVQLYGPSGAAVWNSPTIDTVKRALYITTGDSYSDPPARTSDAFLALDLATGKILWSRQMTEGDAFTVACGNPALQDACPEAKGPDFDFGSSPILVNLPNGKRALIAGQKSGVVHAVDPDQQGEVLWQTRIGHGSALGGIQWGSATDGNNVYAALSDVAFRAVPAGTPGARQGLLGFTALDPKSGGGLFALKLATGERAWTTPNPGCGDRPGCSPAQSAAVTAIPGVVFSGSLDGHLRAYATNDGHIVWDVDTGRDYQTVNGVTATGGSIDGPGPVIVGGMLYVNSGYGMFGGAPGNVLLAFSVDGK